MWSDMTRSHDILDWNPEDTEAWEEGNSAIARRNMIWSIATDHVAFGALVGACLPE